MDRVEGEGFVYFNGVPVPTYSTGIMPTYVATTLSQLEPSNRGRTDAVSYMYGTLESQG